MLLWNRVCMEELFDLLDRDYIVIYDNDKLNELANYALLLEDDEQQILFIGKYTLLDILYGRYYWFTKFLVYYESLYGKDESMEQQQFKIIEAIDCIGCVDCSLLEEIERIINQEFTFL